jgi:thiol peroxidase
MSIERKGLFQIAGNDVTIIGPDITVGQQAPEFMTHTQDWNSFSGLEHTKGKVRIIGSLPSLNTSVCDRETRRFNQEAADLGENIVILVISMDLPYTLKNWCGAAGVDKVITLSDHQSAEFGEKYGVLIQERRILRRAIFVVDVNGQVDYVAYMSVLGEEPNYSEVISAAKKALS